jgi:hypothetical protein
MTTVAPHKPLTPSVEEDIQELRRLFQDDFVSARDYFREVYARHGDAPELAYYKGILMPAKPRVTHGNKPLRDLMPDYNWIKSHAHAYYGQWLALYEGQLLAHGMNQREVSEAAHRKVESDQILMFHAVGYPR